MRENLRACLVAGQRAPMLARHRLQGWLRLLGWPEAESGDLVLAVSEAVSNAVEHAYLADELAGEVELVAVEVAGLDGACRVVITVTDHGRWRPSAPDPGFRGRGLPMIKVLTESHEVRGTPIGTTVQMISYPVLLGIEIAPVVAKDQVRDRPRPGPTLYL
jgi:serine/threonine-protein kinase RsbW